MDTEPTGLKVFRSDKQNPPEESHSPIPEPPEESHTLNLDEIKQKIASCQEDIENSYLKVGRLLGEAKELFGEHGEWLGWLKANVDMSICKAQRLMRVARWVESNEAPVPHLTFSQAYILCRLSPKELEEFWSYIQGKEKVTDMPKRELEAAVRNFLKSKNGKSPAVQAPQQEEVHDSEKDDIPERFDQIKSEVSKLASLVDTASEKYDLYATDLCELCQTIIQKLSPEDVESI